MTKKAEPKIAYFAAGTFEPRSDIDLPAEFIKMVNDLCRRNGMASELLCTSREDVKAACSAAGMPEEVWQDQTTHLFRITIEEIDKENLQ